MGLNHYWLVEMTRVTRIQILLPSYLSGFLMYWCQIYSKVVCVICGHSQV